MMDSQVSMNQAFISKLNDILEENFHNEHFGVNELAGSAGVSRSKLHRKLNEIKGQSASEFIKLFRLEKAHELLKNNVSSVSEIAYAVGFNSPSYFSKCFNEHYKCSPREITRRKKQLIVQDKVKKSIDSVSFKGRILIIFSILLIAIFSWTFYSSDKKKEEKRSYSIAILPFKNLSDDPSNQYFADGVMDVILNHLSGMENFRVISRTTMEQYRKTTKTIPEIADELNVLYVLEASVQKHIDQIRIVVQLIDAKKDIHLWSHDYERAYEDIFSLQSDIAIQVAKQLEKTISPSELKKIEERPTENIEAFNLYLKGRFFWHRRTRDDLEKSVTYFRQALDLDSTYALAYAGLADAYHIMAWWRWIDMVEGFEKTRDYASKALSLNPNLASAYATMGSNSTWYDRDWKKAENEFKKAISIDPNYATAHQWYAELLNVLGRKEEAREQINLALKNNPNSWAINNISAIIYYNNYEFEMAIKEATKAHEIRKSSSYSWFMFKCYIRLGQEQKAIDMLKTNLADSLKKTHTIIDIVYQKEGIEGVVHWYVENVLSREHEKYREMAYSYALIGDSQKALEYLEKSYEIGDPVLLEIRKMIDFEFLKDEDRFTVLLKKMNL